MTHHTISPSKWPNTGEPNKWFMYAARFVNEIASAPGFWCRNSNFKYLTIRIDTRERQDFKVYIDGPDSEKIEVSADEVIAAIFEWQQKFPTLVHVEADARSERDQLLSHAKSALDMCEKIASGHSDDDLSHVEFRNTVAAWACDFIETAGPAIDAVDQQMGR